MAWRKQDKSISHQVVPGCSVPFLTSPPSFSAPPNVCAELRNSQSRLQQKRANKIHVRIVDSFKYKAKYILPQQNQKLPLILKTAMLPLFAEKKYPTFLCEQRKFGCRGGGRIMLNSSRLIVPRR